jgi:allantoin racemase
MPGHELVAELQARPLRVTYQSFGQRVGMEQYQAFLRQEAIAAAGPAVEVDLRCLEQAALAGKGYSSAEALELPALLRSIADALAEGSEAVAIANGFDPGLWQARELFDAPVLGLFETVAFHGLRMGARLGVLCSGRSGPMRIQELVSRYGIATRVAPPRAVGINVPTVLSGFADDGAWSRIAQEVDNVIGQLATDGAELVLIASGVLWALIRARELDQAAALPVLANVPILVQELMAAARLSRLGVRAVSRAGRFAMPPPSVLERLRGP